MTRHASPPGRVEDAPAPRDDLPTRRDSDGNTYPFEPHTRPGWFRVYGERGAMVPKAITPFAFFEREDGAFVRKFSGPEVMVWRDSHKPWGAVSKGGVVLSAEPRGRHGIARQRRRWSTAEAAMAAVDREFPMEVEPREWKRAVRDFAREQNDE